MKRELSPAARVLLDRTIMTAFAAGVYKDIDEPDLKGRPIDAKTENLCFKINGFASHHLWRLLKDHNIELENPYDTYVRGQHPGAMRYIRQAFNEVRIKQTEEQRQAQLPEEGFIVDVSYQQNVHTLRRWFRAFTGRRLPDCMVIPFTPGSRKMDRQIRRGLRKHGVRWDLRHWYVNPFPYPHRTREA